MSTSAGIKRVKSGCVTCRIRRIKCDEQKPTCSRCVSTGRKCDGYTTLPFSRRDLQEAARWPSSQRVNPNSGYTHNQAEALIPRLITDPAFEDLLEKRYFQFFRLKTVAGTNSVVNCRFWDRIVLQACHTEPTVKHAVLALSSWHQSDVPLGSETRIQLRFYAQKQYYKALAAARVLIASSNAEDVDRILLACILFVIFESVRGDYKIAAMHMDHGVAIIARNAHRFAERRRRKDILEIQQAFARLDLFALCFSDHTAPYKQTLAHFLETCPSLTPSRFDDVGEAQACLIDLCRWFIRIWICLEHHGCHSDVHMLAKYQKEKIKCAKVLEEWHWHFEEVVERTHAEEWLATLNVRSWYAVFAVLAKSGCYGPETRYDPYVDKFAESIGYAQRLLDLLPREDSAPTFSYDFGYLVPVYICATKCRDPVLRRRAIAILQHHPRQEGIWQSTAAATAAVQWLAIEEDGLGSVTCAREIPEHKRIKTIETRVDFANRMTYLKLRPRGITTAYAVMASCDHSETSGG